jgi:Flp pilus assembly protein TadD
MLKWKANSTIRKELICALLVILAVAVYWPVIHCGFVDFDDDYYVFDNPRVLSGLNSGNVVWAFTTRHASNWHPVTWISHMLDQELFGSGPAGPHAMNLLLHTCNTALLFLLLRRMTGAQWRSAIVAALFAVHPMHVESVAWIAERKDVLSTFFLFLAIDAYITHAQSTAAGTRLRLLSREYLLVLVFFAMGLMSKPMLVTLPGLLLLLDFWPLNRVPTILPIGSRTLQLGLPAGKWGTLSWRDLVIEKIPLAALSIISCVLTMWAQTVARIDFEHLGFLHRVASSVVSYGRYLFKAIWPTKLVLIYPYPLRVSLPQLIIAAVGVAILCWIAVKCARTRPYLFTGWFWFMGTLVPVIGWVQVGMQSIADRYTYVPFIGLFIAAVWGLYDLRLEWRPSRGWTVLALVPIAACAFATRAQLSYWKDSRTLFEHTLRWTTNNYLIEANFGRLLFKKGELKEAYPHLANVTRITPRNAEAHHRLGMLLMQQNELTNAAQELEIAVRLEPGFWRAHGMLGLAYLRQTNLEKASFHFAETVRLNPTNSEMRFYYATTLSQLGRVPDAVKQYHQTLDLNPGMVGALNNLAWILASSPSSEIRNGGEAVTLAELGCQFTSYRNPELLSTLAVAYAETGRFSEATDTAEKAKDLAEAAGNVRLARENTERAQLFRLQKAFHETPELRH